jgi:hypothetical protein
MLLLRMSCSLIFLYHHEEVRNFILKEYGVTPDLFLLIRKYLVYRVLKKSYVSKICFLLIV